MNSVLIKHFNIGIEVSSNNDKFLDFVSHYFSLDSTGNPAIRVAVNFIPGYYFKLGAKKNYNLQTILGENIGQDQSGNFSFRFQEMSGTFNFNSSPWQANCDFQKNFFKHLANLIFFKGRKTSEHYFRTISRLFIQNLLFMQLKQSANSAILSAAAIAINGQAYVFAGLPGSGKSTVITAIKELLPQAELLTENYLVIKDGQALAFTEGKAKTNHQAFPIAQVFILSRGKELSLTELSAEASFNRLKAIDQLTAEMPEHGPFLGTTLLSDNFNYIWSDNYLREFIKSHPVINLVADNNLVEFKKYFLENYGRTN